MRFVLQRRAIFRRQNFQKCSETVCCLTFSMCKCASRHSSVQFFDIKNFKKALRSWGVLYIFTSKCPSRHSGVQFLDIFTSKSAPRPWVFSHFHLEMCHSGGNFWFILSPDDSAPVALTGLLFDWPDTRIIEKNTAFRDFWKHLTRMYLLSSDFRAIAASFFWLYFFSSAFHLLFQLSILSEVSI